jgi:hypothetical protein
VIAGSYLLRIRDTPSRRRPLCSSFHPVRLFIRIHRDHSFLFFPPPFLLSSLPSTSRTFPLPFSMVKFSLPSRDKDKSQFQAGTSFAPILAGRFKPSVPSTPAVLRRLKSTDAATSKAKQQTHLPLMTLRLSSPSFLDSVVHDGSSDNPLYVIDTDDNVTKVRRSDPKGFVKVCCVRWPTDPIRSSHKNKDLSGVEVAFGRGTWKAADDFLGYSYSSLSRFVSACCIVDIPLDFHYDSYRKFYVPHHPHSLKWKPYGTHYAVRRQQ